MKKTVSILAIENIRQERKTAIAKLYVEHREEFVAWTKGKHQLDEETILDIYQEAVAILYEKAMQDQLNEITSSLKTYLFGIAKNLILRKFEKQNITNKHVERVNEHYLFQYEPEEPISDRGVLAKKELHEMEEPCKSILLLYYFENYSLTEVAEQLNYTNPNVVKTQKSRCLSKLRGLVKTKLAIV